MEREEQRLIKKFMLEVFKKSERKNIDGNVVFVGCLSELFLMGLLCCPDQNFFNECIKRAYEIATEEHNKYYNK